MSADQLVLEMSSQTEGNPSVFLKKDWLSILDNTSGSYSSNQAVIDTSQLANSNKYMNYQEAYLAVPLLLTFSASAASASSFLPGTAGSSADHLLGLKNSYTSLIHSFTLDYMGTTVIQQQPFVSIWNAFRLMTTLSWEDVVTQGSTIGFYPDDALSFAYNDASVTAANTQGFGVCFNNNAITAGPPVSGVNNSYNPSNIGFLKRQQYVNYDADGLTAPSCSAFLTLLTRTNASTLYKSQVITKQDGTASVPGVFQQQIMAIIKLKHLHSFFENIPLLKGVFMKATISLNNANISFATSAAGTFQAPATTAISVSVPSGGVNPLMVASGVALPTGAATANGAAASLLGAPATYYCSLSVGNTCLNPLQASQSGVGTSGLLKQITLNVPAYSLAPVFEAAYLSSPIRKIDFTDIYTYQVLNTSAGSNFNSLITNGIASIKSVLVLPFLTTASNAASLSPLLSPFDAAGCGPTSPYCLLNNFNVVVAGANAIYNTERYTYEHFQNQFYGQRAINGGLIDGSTSGLIGQLDWETAYNYYYVNVARALPIEDNVPKSVSIIGQNMSAKAIDMYVFIEYAQSLTIDVLTGQRV
jgi:hypothetical protein